VRHSLPVIKASFDMLVAVSPFVRRFMIHGLYEVLGRLDRAEELTFLNYGYANGANGELILDPCDEPNRWAIQLYDHVTSATDLRGKHVLEVGCGRGGGAAYIARQRSPASMLGLDLSERAVAFCKRRHRADALSFAQGDAESLPFDDERFDVVLNVESSHGYGRLDRFLGEVSRVLRPGGEFLYTDHRAPSQLAAWRATLDSSGLIQLEEMEITQYVLMALDFDHARKASLIERRCPAPLRQSLREFAAVRGSRAYERFRTGDTRYLSFRFRKPESATKSGAIGLTTVSDSVIIQG
jgi:ubiquinone/menaquinone biosynthesis C-methylase UbiE